MKLDLGCGLMKHPGFVGLDRQHLPQVDLVCDMTRGIPLPESSVEFVMASRSLPYVENLQAVLREIYRVCADRAVVCILAPYAHNLRHRSNPYLRQLFDEYTPAYLTSQLDPEPPSGFGYLANAAASYPGDAPAPYDFRLLRMELFYQPPYTSLLYEEEDLEFLRLTHLNIVDEIMYHLVAVKTPMHRSELIELARHSFPEPIWAAALRQRNSTDSEPADAGIVVTGTADAYSARTKAGSVEVDRTRAGEETGESECAGDEAAEGIIIGSKMEDPGDAVAGERAHPEPAGGSAEHAAGSPAERPAHGPSAKTADAPPAKTADAPPASTTDAPAVKAADAPAASTADSSAEKAAVRPAVNVTDASAEPRADISAETTADSPTDHTANNPAVNAAVGSAEKAADDSAHNAADGSADHSANHSAENSPDAPAGNTAAHTAESAAAGGIVMPSAPGGTAGGEPPTAPFPQPIRRKRPPRPTKTHTKNHPPSVRRMVKK